MTQVDIFCRQVRARSVEHRQAVNALHRMPGPVVSILRQELDSLVRVIYLLSQSDRAYRSRLIDASISGQKWTAKNSRDRITDQEMAGLAQALHGWTCSVYKFGCGFIHLSNMHDYRDRDPLSQISEADRQAILHYLRYYHGGPNTETPTFSDIVPFLPRVFEKIADNLECYLKQLENNEDIDRSS